MYVGYFFFACEGQSLHFIYFISIRLLSDFTITFSADVGVFFFFFYSSLHFVHWKLHNVWGIWHTSYNLRYQKVTIGNLAHCRLLFFAIFIHTQKNIKSFIILKIYNLSSTLVFNPKVNYSINAINNKHMRYTGASIYSTLNFF